ncbi:unnamed protein product [Acanthoscelides obtectus]|uniref:Uncharacterized protein n=1 Tax=Acanthoscelides obtectus TaxID=200917 RepID=A0A9P0K0Z3_ACAOB|nr:unnamed protein product [Acanthoscelides obtectus]CAK1664013.1 hypothetical protein AOBTE_LOCUS24002 [Acanthoscelides obtectus]
MVSALFPVEKNYDGFASRLVVTFSYATSIHERTISLSVQELPSSAEGWKKVADESYIMWNSHLCLGALDGKHVDFAAPKKKSVSKRQLTEAF